MSLSGHNGDILADSIALPRCVQTTHESKAMFVNDNMRKKAPHKQWLLEIDYHKLAQEKGIFWIADTLPQSVMHSTLWACKQGHQWTQRYNNIQRNGCPYCTKHLKTGADWQAIVDGKHLILIGNIMPKFTQKTLWQCPRGHIFLSSPIRIRNAIGNGCPECYTNRINPAVDENLLNEYIAAGNRYGLKLVGDVPYGIKDNAEWECANGHRINRPLKYLKSDRFSGCKKCSSPLRTVDDYFELAHKHNITWLGPFGTTREKTHWVCKKGHIWQSAFHTISQGHLCSKCAFKIHSGEGHPMWRGGDFRYGAGWTKEVKERIRQRDGDACLLTGLSRKNSHLHIHHIVPARIAPQEWRHSEQNLILVSTKIHAILDFNVEWSIPLLRSILQHQYGYSYTMMDYSLLDLERKNIGRISFEAFMEEFQKQGLTIRSHLPPRRMA